MDTNDILKQTKDTWNRYIYESGDTIYQQNYIYKSNSDVDHYRMGYWDFPYFIAMPLTKMGIELPNRALEIGVGTGRLAACASNMFEHVCGIDISEEVIKKASTYLNKIGCKNIELKVNDGQTIPYPDNNFDLVYSLIVFIHIPSKIIVEKYIKETYRVLKKGGVARIQLRYAGFLTLKGKDFGEIDENWDLTEGCSWTRLEARRLFKSEGFKILKINRDYRNAWQRQKSKTQLWITATKP
ncbi:MAG: Methyltransferase type 11 [Candidatus Brocadiaceae bacterium]|nr:Methyltransferase type 11 [Candidatus Brocadiaceae bacterium]